MARLTQNGLVKQSVSLSLTGGIDRKTDPKQLQNGQMYTADNVQYITEGQIRKRFGYNNLTPPGGLQGAPFSAVGCRDNVEPLVLGTNFLNRYNPTTGLSTSIPANTQGRLSATPITASSGVGTIATPPVNASCATDGQKYTLVVWDENDTSARYVFYGIQDLSTGSWIISPQQITLSTGSFTDSSSIKYTITDQCRPRAFYYNGYFYIAVQFNGSGTSGSNTVYGSAVEAYAIQLTNLAAGLLNTSLFVLLTSNGGMASAQVNTGINPWDAAIYNGQFYFTYLRSSTTTTGNINTFTISGTNFNAANSATYTRTASQAAGFDRVTIAIGTNTAVPIAITTNTCFITLKSNLTSNTLTTYTSPIASGPAAPMTATIWIGNIAYGFAITAPYSAGNSQDWYVNLLGVNVNTNTLIVTALFTPPSTSFATSIVSRPFVYNNKLYIWLFASGYLGWGVYREHVLCELNPANVALNYVARTSYQNAGLNTQLYNTVPTDIINIPGTNQFVTFLTQTSDSVGGQPAVAAVPANPNTGAAAVAAKQAIISTTYYGSLNRMQFDFTPATPSAILNLPSGGVFITGAFPQQYDGRTLCEAGFSVAPELLTAPGVPTTYAPSVRSSTGGLVAGTYTYYLVFCRRDAYGNILRSAPSSPYMVTTTGTSSQVLISVPTYSRVPNVFIELYRTTIAAPAQPYFVAKLQNGVSYFDNSPDSALVNNATLYTYAGEYPNDPPPAVYSMALGETRAYIIPSDSRNTIWCSKKYSPGRSVEWTSNLILSEGGTHSGVFTAVAVLDTNVIVFKQDQILYFYGDGPDNAGATGSFSAFQRLSSDVGCTDPGSLAIVPQGLLFRSQRGIELLSRGLQVQYVGFPIEPIAQSITIIASAVVMPQYEQVRFVPSVSGQPVLVYDYLKERWSTYSNMTALSAANVLGNYWWISSDGSTCNIETPGQFLDAGSNFITMTLETPEIPSAAIQGWGRVYRIGILGEMRTSHLLTTSFAYDHQETYTDAIVYNAASSNDAVGAGATLYIDNQGQNPASFINVPGPIQVRFSRVPRQVMQTLRLMLQDSPLTVYYYNDAFQAETLPIGESCAISNITLEVGQKALLAKLPASQTV